MENGNIFEKIMKDTGTNNFEELLEWVKNNSETELAKSIMEFLSFVDGQENKQILLHNFLFLIKNTWIKN